MLHAVALSELSEQCKLTIMAWERLEKHTESGPLGSANEIGAWTREISLDVSSILSAYSAISHILWPTPGNIRSEFERTVARTRAVLVRRTLGMADERPLISRDVRNAFEHADEWIDDWILDQPWPEDLPPEVPASWSFSGYPREKEPAGHSTRAFRYINYLTGDVRIASVWVNLLDVKTLAQRILDHIPQDSQTVWTDEASTAKRA